MEQIRTLEKWYEIMELAKVQPLLIMKYSMTCVSSISAIKEYRALETTLPKYLVVVQTCREVSNVIAADLGVRHESPQLLILNEGRAVWQATHYKIKKSPVIQAIVQYTNN